jgi:dTDP-4-dehydrorhamnose reductase
VEKFGMKILVTGGKGQLGRAFGAIKSPFYDIYCLDKDELDFTKIYEVQKTIDEIKPSIVIHAGAYTNVEMAGENILEAIKINVTGTRNIAEVCEWNNIKMVYISTDYVFDGKKTIPYVEADIPDPLNVYGMTKLHGEEVVQEVCKKHYIVRTSWMFGEGKNFVQAIINLTKEQDNVKIICDQVGNPTYAPDLAKAILELIETDIYGIYHITNSGACSWYEYAKKITDVLNIDTKIIPIKTEEFNQIAVRPKYSVLDNNKFNSLVRYELRNWQDALNDYLNVKK